jgi:hypothetical protein
VSEGRGPARDYCPGEAEGHAMVSRSAGQKVRWVEICSLCGWIDSAALDGWADNAIKESMTARAKRIAVAAETEPFAFAQQKGEELTLQEILFQSLGAASMCWESVDKAGVFDSTRAKEIGLALTAEVDRALAIVQVTPWSELAYELYALACNSTALEPSKAQEWNAAFERLKEQFNSLLKQYRPEPPIS